jgi:tetratricopeptide (TPR) repeat protein
VTTPLVVTVTLGETTLATRTVDLTPFARGELEIGSEAEPLAPVPFPVADDQEADKTGDDPDAANPGPANPLLATATVDVRIVASEPFVSAEDASRGRVATFAPLAIASLPARLLETNDANLVGDRSPFEFTVAVPLAGVPHAVIPGGVIVEVPAEEAEDDGGEPEPEPNPPTREIRWAPDAAVTRWLPAATVADLTRRIKGRGTLYPLEIARYCAADSGASDPAYANYAALAPASLDAWLEPGATACAGAARLVAPEFGHKSALPAPDESGAKAIAEELVPAGAIAWAEAEEAPTLAFALELDRPLLAPWKPPAPAEMRVADLLPRREPLGEIQAPEDAARAFRAEVLRAARSLSEEYAAMFTGDPERLRATRGGHAEGDDGARGGDEEENESESSRKAARRKALVFELNRSGKYHDLKERLREAARGIIKERFFQGGEGVQGKYNELYVHLVEEMHAALGDLGRAPGPEGSADSPPDPSPAYDVEKLARFKALADEYEINADWDVAEKWHQERLLLTRDVPEVWADLGAFLARREKWGKSEEAFKEALCLDERHVPSLLAMTALALRDEEFRRAEVYAQAVTAEADPGDAIAWAMLAVTYRKLREEELSAYGPKGRNPNEDPDESEDSRLTDATNCAFEARRLTTVARDAMVAEAEASGASAPDASTLEKALPLPAHVRLAAFFLDMHMPAEACAALDLGDFQTSASDHSMARTLCLARAAALEGAADASFGHLMDAIAVDATDPRPFELLGDSHKTEGRAKDAAEAYTHAMALSGGGTGGDDDDVSLMGTRSGASLKLFLDLGQSLLASDQTADARGAFSAACELAPCASAWLGVGACLYREGELEGAEAALAEANLLDPTNARVWGYLCVVALAGARAEEAASALRHAFKQGLGDPGLLAEIGGMMLAIGEWKNAEAALRRAVKRGAGVDARLDLGIATRERGDLDDAKIELKFAAATAREEGRVDALEKILEVLVATYDELGEDHMASQARRELEEVRG